MDSPERASRRRGPGCPATAIDNLRMPSAAIPRPVSSGMRDLVDQGSEASPAIHFAIRSAGGWFVQVIRFFDDVLRRKM